MRVSASDAMLLANAPPLRTLTPPGRPNKAARGRNPITGYEPKYPPNRGPGSQVGLTLHDGRPFMLPAKGTIAAIGAENASHQLHAMSPAGRAKSDRLRYELWCEANKRAQIERELRQVRIHGRSRPPWVGDGAAAGYQSLYPQTR